MAAALLGFLGLAEVLTVTRGPGPGLDPDSAQYLGAAESLVRGTGFQIPMADWYQPHPTSRLLHFPPGFSLAIAATIKLGLSSNQGARIVNALAAATTVAAVTYLAAAAGGTIAGVIAGIALLVARPFVIVRLSVLSEPLFLCLLALVLWGLAARWPPFVTGLIGALAALTRYAGVGVVGAVILWQLFESVPIRERIKNAVIAALPVVVLFGAWVFNSRHASASATVTIRRFGLYGGFGRTLAQGGRTLGDWLIPLTNEPTQAGAGRALWWWIVGAGVVVVMVSVVGGTRRSLVTNRPIARILGVCGTMLLCYAAVLVVSRLVADPGIPFDDRILAPLVLVVTVAVILATASAWPRWGLLFRAIAVVIFLAWVAASVSASLDDVAWATTNGSDFAGQEWRTSPVLAWARDHAPGTPLYSNWPQAVYFHLHRPAWLLPPPASGPTQWRAFADTLARRRAVVIAFNSPSPDVAPPDSIAAAAHLRVLARLSDGTVYGPPAPISR